MALDLVPTGRDVPNEINVVIEIPKDAEPVKYEVDKATGAIFVDRILSTPMRYPCNYGYVPHTLCGAGDPVDVLVILPLPLVPGSVIRCRPVGMLKGCGKATADHVAQHIEDHHIGVFQQVMLLQKLHRLAHDIAAATGASRGATRLDAFHAVEAGGDVIFRAQFFGVEIHLFQNVDHGRLQPAGQGKGAVMLRVTADLQHALAHFGKGR